MVHIRTQHYKNGSVIWFTETDLEAECKYHDTRHCNA